MRGDPDMPHPGPRQALPRDVLRQRLAAIDALIAWNPDTLHLQPELARGRARHVALIGGADAEKESRK